MVPQSRYRQLWCWNLLSDAVRYDRVGMFLTPAVSETRDRLETVEAALSPVE